MAAAVSRGVNRGALWTLSVCDSCGISSIGVDVRPVLLPGGDPEEEEAHRLHPDDQADRRDLSPGTAASWSLYSLSLSDGNALGISWHRPIQLIEHADVDPKLLAVECEQRLSEVSPSIENHDLSASHAGRTNTNGTPRRFVICCHPSDPCDGCP